MLRRLGAVLTVCWIAHLIPQCNAQTKNFLWKFGNNFILNEFQECQTMPIIVTPLLSNLTDTGVPPYYMLAFESSGVPTTAVIGTDPTHLSWTVDHARGSVLMLVVLDSTGNTGGIPSTLYNVTASTNTSCLPTIPPSNELASIHPNVTELTTCDPWGLTITGGTKPYQIVLSARNSPVITNVTMGPEDDVFTYIDRADPGTLLMANVVDASGRWGVSTVPVPTTGSSNVDCIGRVSTSKTQQEIQQEAIDNAAKAAREARNRKNMRIIAITLGVGIPIILLVCGAMYWWDRRRKWQFDRDRGVWDGQDVTARVWELPPGTGEMVEIGITETQQRLLDHKRNTSQNTWSASAGTPDRVPLLSPVYYTTPDYVSGWDGVTTAGPSSSASPTESRPTSSVTGTDNMSANMSARQRKALEARGIIPSMVSSSSGANLPPGALPPVLPHQLPSAMHPLDAEIAPDIIIQHRDGGAGVVQELPPPYMGRTDPPERT